MNTTKVILIIGLIYVSLSYKDTSTRNMMLIMSGLIIICMLDLKEGYCTLDSSLQVVRSEHRCIGKGVDGERDSTKDSECSLLIDNIQSDQVSEAETACNENTSCHYIPAGNELINTSQGLKYSILKEYTSNEAVGCPSGQYLKNNLEQCNDASSETTLTNSNLCGEYMTCDEKRMHDITEAVCTNSPSSSGIIEGNCSVDQVLVDQGTVDQGIESVCSGLDATSCGTQTGCSWTPEQRCSEQLDETQCNTHSGICNWEPESGAQVSCPDGKIFDERNKDYIYIQNDIDVDERGGFNESCCINRVKTCTEIYSELEDEGVQDPCNGLQFDTDNENYISIIESTNEDPNELRELFFSSCCINTGLTGDSTTTTTDDNDPCKCGENGNTPYNDYCYPTGIQNEYGLEPNLPSGYKYVKYDGNIDAGTVSKTDDWSDSNLIKCNMGYLWNYYCIRKNEDECTNTITNINNHTTPSPSSTDDSSGESEEDGFFSWLLGGN